MYNTETPLISKKGFTARLWALFDRIGVKEHGRKKLLATWAGLSPTAIGNILREDRPPSNKQNLDQLVDGLFRILRASDKESTVSKSDLKNYLLLGSSLPGKMGLRKKELPTYDTLDVAAQGLLHIALSDAGKELKVNVFKELSKPSLVQLLNKASQINRELDIAVDSREMTEILKALIKSTIRK